MFSISITLIDSDIPFSLPARWGNYYEIVHIQTGTHLNGSKALVLSLVPLTNPKLPELPQGVSPIGSTSFYFHCREYLPCINYPIPPSVGSTYGVSYRISEVKKVKSKAWVHQELRLCDCWRLTLIERRDPVLLLPPTINNK